MRFRWKPWDWWWHWYDWSLSYRSFDHNNLWIGLFALRCGDCKKFTLGCRDNCQWFCGVCPKCLVAPESEEVEIP